MAPARSPLSLSIALAGLALWPACGGGSLTPTGTGGGGGIAITGVGGSNVGTGVGGGSIGIGGAPPVSSCLGPADPRLVVASQRKVQLTSREAINMVRALVGDAATQLVLSGGLFTVPSDVDRTFPPAAASEQLRIVDATSLAPWRDLAAHVATYVSANFTTASGCALTAEECAKAYLRAFAEKAYRRPLDAAEQADVDARYESARSAGGDIPTSVGAAISIILVAPQFLYRSEMGDPGRVSQSPPGIPLRPYELASALSFFLTDGPPDQPLLDDAAAGTLTPDRVAAHVDRLLATPVARDWLRTVMELWFHLNELPGVWFVLDSNRFPEISSSLFADMQTETRMFLDFVLWNGSLTDLLTSNTAFLNSNLATIIYNVPVPAEATATSWVQATLPAAQRGGLLTRAGFLLAALNYGNDVRVALRGRHTATLMTGLLGLPHPDEFNVPGGPIGEALRNFATQTSQEQVASRAAVPLCWSCHGHFDSYGLAFENYDAIGRYRTVDDKGKPADAHATLPPEMGGVRVASAIDLGRVLAASPAFTNQMAWVVLQYAMVDFFAPVERVDPSMGQAGCAVADVVARLEAGRTKTFPALLREVALSPAFSFRGPAPVPLP